MPCPLKKLTALLLAVLVAVSAVSAAVPARAETVTLGGRTYQDGLGMAADLAGAKRALVATVKNRTASVDLSDYGLGTAQLIEIYDQVFYENPDLFYLENGFTYSSHLLRTVPGTVVVGRVEPSYYREFTAADAARYEAAVEQALSVLRPGMTDFDKALALHDYLALHCAYDHTLTRYSPYHALVTGRAVCQGYLLAYSDLLNRAGVENYPAVSYSQDHGWNTVKLDGLWYHVDVTWDHPENKPADWVLHSNFLLSDKVIPLTGSYHQDWVTPHLCTGDRYESTFLTTLRAPVLYPPEGGAWFLLEGRLCVSQDLSTLQYQVASDAGTGSVRDPWTGVIYSPQDARLVYWDGSIYFTDSVNVYRYDLASGRTALHGSYTRGRGFLYGLTVTESGTSAVLSAEVRAYPDGSPLDVLRLETASGDASSHRQVCPSRNFTDVSPEQWYHEAVDYVLEAGLMNGVSDTRFAPNGTATRAMVVTILYRMAGSPPAGPVTFSDVDGRSWYAPAVAWAAANGIVTGVTDDTFCPDDPVTREQLAAILYRYARYAGLAPEAGGDLSGFADAARISSYARTPLSWACGAGLLTGRSAGTLAPKDTATRAETAAILMRLSGLLDAA